MTWINIRDDVYSALSNDSTLISLLGGNYVFPQGAGDSTHYPYITYFEINNFDDNYSDNAATASQIRIQIDVWAKGSTSAIAEAADTVMKSLGFTRSYAGDLYEKDTKTNHKAIRYKIAKSY